MNRIAVNHPVTARSAALTRPAEGLFIPAGTVAAGTVQRRVSRRLIGRGKRERSALRSLANVTDHLFDMWRQLDYNVRHLD